MKTKEFQSFVEQLGELSAVQRDALVSALQSKASANDVIAMIEARFAAAPACGHCHSERIGPWAWSADCSATSARSVGARSTP